MATVLITGRGGRENAIARALAGHRIIQSTEKDIDRLLQLAQRENADLTIVGGEDLLVAGIVDRFEAAGMNIFGPNQAAAKLEGSKAYAKDFMAKYGVKTARYQTHTQIETARAALADFDLPVVVKASGLAAGKGVLICETKAEAEAAIDSLLRDGQFGAAGETIVIEEFLRGVEASILALANETAIVPLASAKDHKKIGEGETGPNTGGMGTFSPNPHYDQAAQAAFESDILEPTLRGIQAENLKFAGVIFFGLMITERGVYLLEYNMRWGDPETQVVLPRVEQDLYALIEKCLNRTLTRADVSFSPDSQICLVLASAGYPGKYETGLPITGLEQVDYLDAGVEYRDGQPYTAGGRVLNLLASGKDLAQARRRVYEAAEKVHFEGKTYRRDIGIEAEK